MFQNIHCDDIDIATSHTTSNHPFLQSPCCVLPRIAAAVAQALKSNEFTARDRHAFALALHGVTTQLDEAAIITALHASCDTQAPTVSQQAMVEDLYVTSDASVTCKTLAVAVNKLNSNVLCSLHRIARAQCQASGVNQCSRQLSRSSHAVVVLVAVLGALCVIGTCIAIAIARGRHHRSSSRSNTLDTGDLSKLTQTLAAPPPLLS